MPGSRSHAWRTSQAERPLKGRPYLERPVEIIGQIQRGAHISTDPRSAPSAPLFVGITP